MLTCNNNVNLLGFIVPLNYLFNWICINFQPTNCQLSSHLPLFEGLRNPLFWYPEVSLFMKATQRHNSSKLPRNISFHSLPLYEFI